MILFVLPNEVARMAKFTLEEIMYGEKYNIESSVFMAACEIAKQGIKPADIREKTADVV